MKFSRSEKLLEYTASRFEKGIFYRPKFNVSTRFKIALRKTINFLLFKKSNFPKYDFFWTNAMEAMAIYYTSDRSEYYREVLLRFYEGKRNKVECVDSCMHAYLLIKLREAGVAGFDNIIQSAFEFLSRESERSLSGVVPYRPMQNTYYVDTIGMICPFLAAYGVNFNNKKATELAIKQILDFFDCAGGRRFTFHAYDFDGKKLGNEGWGRGLGWLLWGMVDTLEYLFEDHSQYDHIKHRFQNLIEEVWSCRSDSEGFGWDLLSHGSSIDHSVSAMYGYAVLRGVQIGILDDSYLKRVEQCLFWILKSTDDTGALGNVSGECMGLGKYSNVFANYPWGQAPAVILADYCLKKGITL